MLGLNLRLGHAGVEADRELNVTDTRGTVEGRHDVIGRRVVDDDDGFHGPRSLCLRVRCCNDCNAVRLYDALFATSVASAKRQNETKGCTIREPFSNPNLIRRKASKSVSRRQLFRFEWRTTCFVRSVRLRHV